MITIYLDKTNRFNWYQLRLFWLKYRHDHLLVNNKVENVIHRSVHSVFFYKRYAHIHRSRGWKDDLSY
jgi:hypothetical protein